MIIHRENEGRVRRRIRYTKYFLMHVAPWRAKMAIQKVKLSGFVPIPLSHWAYLVVVPTFTFQNQLEYHKQHCDLSPFTGYCPKAQTFWSLPVNYCPLCTLDLSRVRGYKLLPDQIVLIRQSDRMTGPIPHQVSQEELSTRLPREHIFPSTVAFCPM